MTAKPCLTTQLLLSKVNLSELTNFIMQHIKSNRSIDEFWNLVYLGAEDGLRFL